MSRPKVIAPKNLPTNPPIWTPVLTWLILDRLQPAGWVYGVVWTIVIIICAFSLFRFFYQDETELEEIKLKQKISDAVNK